MANNVLIGTNATWTTAGNWSTGSALANTNAAFITNNATTFTTGLDQNAVTLASFVQDMSFTGQIGVNDPAGNTYLKIAATTFTLGALALGGGNPNGSRLININAGSGNAPIVNIQNSANSGSAAGQAPIKLLGSSLTINLTNGIVSVAAMATESAGILALNVAGGSRGVSPQAFIGAGGTLTTLNQNAGAVTSASQSTITTATINSGGSFTHAGTGGFTTLSVNDSATVLYNGSGTIGTLSVTGTIDFSNGGSAVTVTNTTFYAGAKLIDPLGRIVFTNPPVLSGCSLKDLTINRGVGRVF